MSEPVSEKDVEMDAADDGGDEPTRTRTTASGPPLEDEADLLAEEDIEDADDVRRFVGRRRPWLRPETKRDRRRRSGALYWAFVYVLLMAGATSMIGFIAVRGYLALWPGPTSTGATVARQVVPWVFFAIFVGFAAYVTRNVVRTIGYALLFLLPYLIFLFLQQATDAAVWLVGWIPGETQVYGLAAFGPLVAIVLLGRDFVRWQLWVEYPEDSCWECGSRIASERWTFCPVCGSDLQLQRHEEAFDEEEAVADT